MQENVLRLLGDAGVRLAFDRRGYRPSLSLAGFETKLLKPQNIVEMLHVGSRDLGFAGADRVAEKGVELTELLDTGLDPVRIVAAASPGSSTGTGRPGRRSRSRASTSGRRRSGWRGASYRDASHLRSFGATEVFPPEDADVIVDNAATGQPLRPMA